MLLLAATLATTAGFAQSRLPSVDRFTATTTSMTPSDIGLRIDVREWSDEESRAAVLAALEREADARGALASLPTLGYVWQSNAGVGYSVKYAHRVALPDGGLRVTFVTDRPLGAHDFRPWRADSGEPESKPAYSVIELYLDDDGAGSGTLSLATGVRLDAANGIVTLADGPHVLSGAKEEPKPYWVSGT